MRDPVDDFNPNLHPEPECPGCGEPGIGVCHCCAGTCEHVDAYDNPTCFREPLLDHASLGPVLSPLRGRGRGG